MPNICYQPPMRRECCGFDRGWFLRLALDQPDDLIVGSAGSTGEVEAISIPSVSPLPPIARLKPVPYAPPMIVRRPSGFIPPCLPSKAARPPSGPLWVHEIKHDGYRSMVRSSRRCAWLLRCQIYGRTRNSSIRSCRSIAFRRGPRGQTETRHEPHSFSGIVRQNQRSLPCLDGAMGIAANLASRERMPGEPERNRSCPVYVGI